MPSHALIEAIQQGDAGAVKNVIAADPYALSSNEDAASPVLAAMYYGHPDIANYIADRTDLNVFEAAAAGKVDRLERLLAANPDITRQTTDGWTPLHLAAFFGRTEAAQRLIDAGADLKGISENTTGNTPLHAAIAGRCDEELISKLLTAGADPGIASAEGYTPLHVAASRGNQRVCDWLLERGATPSSRMKDGKTPADIAAERGHAPLSDYLRALK